MSEELTEPAVEQPAGAGDVPGADAPGAAIFICPACGNRYDDATTCANGHVPTETVEYDRETVSRADGGDAEAIASVNETASSAAAGNLAGVVPTEATPAPVPGAPVPAAAPADPVATAGAAAVDPTATAPGDAAAIAAGSPTTAAPAVATTTTPDGMGGTPASAMTPDGVHPNVAAIGAALADLDGAIRAARTALGLG